MTETERENIRESTREGLDSAALKGKHGGRPPVITVRACRGSSAQGHCARRRPAS
ncbi:hypothetical protein [Streptomyces sp. NPDC020362]|uniref:hypothetical protein n=1 Tax=unclassified Streptomyces TaxID=2593676 RepID=UPI0033C62C83